MKKEQQEERLPRVSEKEMLILDLLLDNAGREMYGLELVKLSKGDLKRGTIYVTLDRMETKNYIESRREAAPPDGSFMIPRRLYRVTDYGQKVYSLHQRLEEARREQLLAARGPAP